MARAAPSDRSAAAPAMPSTESDHERTCRATPTNDDSLVCGRVAVLRGALSLTIKGLPVARLRGVAMSNSSAAARHASAGRTIARRSSHAAIEMLTRFHRMPLTNAALYEPV